jgi:hypothetical protein
VKIYLLLVDHERFFFYSDESESSHGGGEGDDSTSIARSGLRGWLHNRYMKFKAAWGHADSGALLWVRRSWDWLHSLTHPDEAMLARLRTARRIDLHHPAARSEPEVRVIWRDYLARQWKRHLVWMSVNAVIAPVAIATLWILPGPNLIGYWFAYRAIHHILVVWGIRRVAGNEIPIELHPVMALDLPVECDEGGKARHAALNGAAERLDEHVARCRGPHSGTRDSGRRASTMTPTKQEFPDTQTEKP